MKVLWGLGKVLTLLFWLVVLVNLVNPLVSPFRLLVNLAGSLLLLTHLLEILLFNGSLQDRPQPWRDRAQILLFGMFHLQILPLPAREEVSHA
ncbi:DUF1145 domain-containing protein [Pseudomonas gingeri NCPPB 3146 = LMG 5327]|uniref:DUF1145 domain-containing protein n=2 Tax=Pseudomonas gingeri TaxID=117681 RepID=A0A7Y7Y3T0_9PSED|nr:MULTISPECIES: DUF1145 domain-containing protein [Pseudomonas]NVZ26092.1 DUF1145 domain-containing protein [Pseudomonas gingeri]NVZ61081.1 DUF1145 domain-containing protein [Pseudomonas gingeri]NVZ79752.1 DUF1145 domain-containing protein [Pseudomonas gingeri]NWA08099.1 DUF1145 domain-containing protein [Pseudomonas gingeri]NWC17342.1 DUF1145 domain-containing protein [Pseudomonas gingeri]